MSNFKLDFKHLSEENIKFGLLEFFSIGYVLIFTVLALIKSNYEFLYYSGYMIAIIFFVRRYYKIFHLTYGVMFFLSLFGFLHLLGGTFHIGEIRLYDYWLIQDIFKWDNLVHAIGGVIATIISFNLLINHIDKEIKHNFIAIFILLITISSGIGTYNEILELFAVILFDAGKAVGDYINNALDLVYNLIGSIFAAIGIYYYQLKQSKKR